MKALWLLLGLQLWGWARFALSGLRTLRGALLTVLTLSMIVPWLLFVVLVPLLNSDAPRLETEALLRYGPAALLAYVVLGVVFSPSSQPLYFTPAEIQFLFAGPFARWQLLLYKVTLALLVSVPTAVVMALVVRVQEGMFIGKLLGVVLTVTFLVLFSLALGLLTTWLWASLHTRTRQALAVGALAVLAGAALLLGQSVQWDMTVLGQRLFDHPAWQTVTWPLASFFRLMTATRWDALLAALGVAVTLNTMVLLLIFGLDTQFLEQSAAGSAALYARLLRARGQKVAVEPMERREYKRTWSLPMFPYLGGVGPIVWRQMVTGYRSIGRISLVVVLLGGSVAGPILAMSSSEKIGVLIGMLVGMTVWLSLFLPLLVPFDFRGDIDRMATLKTLPIAAWRLALGQMIVPSLVMTFAKSLILVGVGISFPSFLSYLLMGLLIICVFDLYVIGVENLLFLLFPTRVGAVTPGDFQAMGRNILLSFARGFSLIVPAFGAGIGTLVGYLSGWIWLGVLVGVVPVVVAFAGIVAAAGWAFTQFDVGRTTPA
ncbi:MAG: putative ABC exporter domain-containing protein [Gemmataceae bacterium]